MGLGRRTYGLAVLLISNVLNKRQHVYLISCRKDVARFSALFAFNLSTLVTLLQHGPTSVFV
jgi:hypothetical protein